MDHRHTTVRVDGYWAYWGGGVTKSQGQDKKTTLSVVYDLKLAVVCGRYFGPRKTLYNINHRCIDKKGVHLVEFLPPRDGGEKIFFLRRGSAVFILRNKMYVYTIYTYIYRTTATPGYVGRLGENIWQPR